MKSLDFLTWPIERARSDLSGSPRLCEAGSNICLDFHGDPLRAGLFIFSDGNHHMALEECAAAFLERNPDAGDVFYATTPPGALVTAMKVGRIHVGNLSLSVHPNIFIGPVQILDSLQASNAVKAHSAFAESRGNVLLIRRGNPKSIQGIADLLRDDVRLTISNPESEKASFEVYASTLLALAGEADLDTAALRQLLGGKGPIVYSSSIHHREIPQAIAKDDADVAVVYYHLALRYRRIFPHLFDFVPLGGSQENPRPSNAHMITRYHIGLVGDGGNWGQDFLQFMVSALAQAIYQKHGLQPTA